ncbi:MAG: uroporphyrinogen decarboxylase family protein [Clostridia bacterium]|jgi:uroporphyrinogen decarboxylase
MRKFESRFADWSYLKDMAGKPDYTRIQKVLAKEKPHQYTLFEFFLHPALYELLSGEKITKDMPDYRLKELQMKAYANAGYDYITFHACPITFPTAAKEQKKTISLNQGAVISSYEDYERYPWPDPSSYDYSLLDYLASRKPEGMGLIPYGPGGVLENVIALVGYDNLCLLMWDEPDLVQAVFDKVGSILTKYYEICAEHPAVIACISNDDWGFNTQTMLSVEQMRKYVFPWHIKIANAIKSRGKFAILHSCGYYGEIIDDMVLDMKYDARHSFEDNIIPIEKAYPQMNKRMALLGGIDVDFICRSRPEDVYNRACRMLELADQGGYALGSGNSIPYYVPAEGYLAMIAAALVNR